MSDPIIYLVDDDEGVRSIIFALLKTRGYQVRLFASGQELLADLDSMKHGCLIVDFNMPEMSGLQLIQETRARGSSIPFLLISGYATISMAVEAMKLGAVTILEKPFVNAEFLQAVAATLDESQRIQDHLASRELQEDHRRSLTPRELQVLKLVVSGCMTKNIAKTLGISTKTVEVHRSNITKKFRVDSVAQLIGRVLSLDPHFLSDSKNGAAVAVTNNLENNVVD